MFNIFTRFGLVLFAVGLSGCTEPFTADLDPPSPRPLVVDGNITSGPGPHSVTLSLAAAFEQSPEGADERVDGARVSIVDQNADTRTRLQETLKGRYETEKGELHGVPGHTYRLEITLPDGREYESVPERMPEPVPLDSTFAAYAPSPAKRIRVLAAADDPGGTPNYYRWSVRVTREYVISSLTPPFYCWEKEMNPSNQIPILNDRLIDGGRIQNQEVYNTRPGFKASRLNQVDVRQLSITENAHDFWSKVEEQVEDADDPFSAPPHPIRGNIVPLQDSINQALGYFEVAGASEQSTVCFRQTDFEKAPPAVSPTGGCPPARDPARGSTFDRPSHWICSTHENQ